jgi:hypothetical protein
MMGAPTYRRQFDYSSLEPTPGTLVFTGSATDGWQPKQLLTGYGFGGRVATNSDGTVLMIGEPGFDQRSGGAIIYTGSATAGWQPKQKLSGLYYNSSFGESVATNSDGTLLMMGGSNYAGFGRGAGTSLIYTGSATAGWKLKTFLTGTYAGEGFGGNGDMVTNSDGTVLMMAGNPNAVRTPEGTITYLFNAGAALVYTLSTSTLGSLSIRTTLVSSGQRCTQPFTNTRWIFGVDKPCFYVPFDYIRSTPNFIWKACPSTVSVTGLILLHTNTKLPINSSNLVVNNAYNSGARYGGIFVPILKDSNYSTSFDYTDSINRAVCNIRVAKALCSDGSSVDFIQPTAVAQISTNVDGVPVFYYNLYGTGTRDFSTAPFQYGSGINKSWVSGSNPSEWGEIPGWNNNLGFDGVDTEAYVCAP